MWDRFVFRLRRFVLSVGGYFDSWRMSVVLMLTAGLYYALLAVWGGLSAQL